MFFKSQTTLMEHLERAIVSEVGLVFLVTEKCESVNRLMEPRV